ncbi:MAG: OmpA family protein [Flavobacteriales bacterium]|nr:OmpA family protein [Flavobacteriales bacterium]
MNFIKYWSQPTQGTPDYFNACSDMAGVPGNVFGDQPAQSGAGYVGLVTFTSAKRDYREYLQVEMERPLTAGEMVCVELHVSASDKAWFVTDGIGVYFSEFKLQSQDQKRFPFTAHVENPRLNVIDNTADWVKISDTYTAKGGERFLTIGNFRGDRDMNVLQRTQSPEADYSNDWAYLYIDNVKVMPVKQRDECSCVNDIIKSAVHDPPLQLSQVREIEFSSILFDFDESTLTSDARAELDRILAIMSRNDEFYLRIIGYTDIVGSDAYNMGLSKHRAEAVISYLENKGASGDRLEMAWRGSTQPVADNTTTDGRAQNRRVEFQVLQPEFTRY